MDYEELKQVAIETDEAAKTTGTLDEYMTQTGLDPQGVREYVTQRAIRLALKLTDDEEKIDEEGRVQTNEDGMVTLTAVQQEIMDIARIAAVDALIVGFMAGRKEND